MRLRALWVVFLFGGCLCVDPSWRYKCDPATGADCGDDAGVDAGQPDAGEPDAGQDAGEDAGQDAGVDGGSDAGAPDAGIPLGAFCALAAVVQCEREIFCNMTVEAARATCEATQMRRCTLLQQIGATGKVVYAPRSAADCVAAWATNSCYAIHDSLGAQPPSCRASFLFTDGDAGVDETCHFRGGPTGIDLGVNLCRGGLSCVPPGLGSCPTCTPFVVPAAPDAGADAGAGACGSSKRCVADAGCVNYGSAGSFCMWLRPAGAACGNPGECLDGKCLFPLDGGTTRQCGARAPGEGCAETECGAGQYCTAVDAGVCAPLVTSGACVRPFRNVETCAPGRVCVGGVCQSSDGGSGSACGVQLNQCNVEQEACIESVSTPGAGFCGARVGLGQPCPNSTVGCQLGLTCFNGTCQPFAVVGTACGSSLPGCLKYLGCNFELPDAGYACNVASLGSPCLNTLFCPSGWCENVCRQLTPPGGACTSNSGCTSNFCPDGGCGDFCI